MLDPHKTSFTNETNYDDYFKSQLLDPIDHSPPVSFSFAILISSRDLQSLLGISFWPTAYSTTTT